MSTIVIYQNKMNGNAAEAVVVRTLITMITVYA